MTEQKSPENSAVQVLHRDLSTQSQLGMLLAVNSVMMQFLTVEKKDEDEDDLSTAPKRGEAHIAAENTLISACDRIDSILKDDKRWGLDFQMRLEKLFEKNTEVAREVAEKQKKLIDECLAKELAEKEAAIQSQKPHVVFRPTLFSLPDQTWVAFLGDPANLPAGIMGTGPNPLAALESFDLAFSGQVAQEREQIMQSIQNEHEALDQIRIEPLGELDQGGEDNARSGEAAGT